MGKGDAGIAIGEMRDLLPPGHVIAADSVRKDDRRARPRGFIVYAAPRPLHEAALRARHRNGLGEGRRRLYDQ